MAEFPTVAELLALRWPPAKGRSAHSSGWPRVSSGELAREFRPALADARAGASGQALEQGGATDRRRRSWPGSSTASPIAVERGTPLAEVLRAQAVDVREAGKRALLEAGGTQGDRDDGAGRLPRPPVTVLFALFPGAIGLQIESPLVHRKPTNDRTCRNAGPAPRRVDAAPARPVAHRSERPGDVPGWVLITVMTAGLVAVLLAVLGRSSATCSNKLCKARQRLRPDARPAATGTSRRTRRRRPSSSPWCPSSWCRSSWASCRWGSSFTSATHSRRAPRRARHGRQLRRDRGDGVARDEAVHRRLVVRRLADGVDRGATSAWRAGVGRRAGRRRRCRPCGLWGSFDSRCRSPRNPRGARRAARRVDLRSAAGGRERGSAIVEFCTLGSLSSDPARLHHAGRLRRPAGRVRAARGRPRRRSRLRAGAGSVGDAEARAREAATIALADQGLSSGISRLWARRS